MHLVENGSLNTAARRSGVAGARPVERSLVHRLIDGILTAIGGSWDRRNGSTARRLRVLETLSIGPKKQLLLIRCDGEKYLVATGPDSVQSILRVDSQARATGPTVVPMWGDRS